MSNKKEIRQLFLLQVSQNLGKPVDSADQQAIDSHLADESELRDSLNIPIPVQIESRPVIQKYTQKASSELVEAIDKDNYNVVKSLLRKGTKATGLVSNPWILNKIKNQIVLNADIELAQLLVSNHFDVTEEGEDGRTFYAQLKNMNQTIFAEFEVSESLKKACELFDDRKPQL